jgi:hypothetical protein
VIEHDHVTARKPGGCRARPNASERRGGLVSYSIHHHFAGFVPAASLWRNIHPHSTNMLFFQAHTSVLLSSNTVVLKIYIYIALTFHITKKRLPPNNKSHLDFRLLQSPNGKLVYPGKILSVLPPSLFDRGSVLRFWILWSW